MFNALFSDALNLWQQGGYLMWPLALLAFFIYYSALELFLYFSRCGFHRPSDRQWMRWIDEPKTAEGEVGRIIRYGQQNVFSLKDIRDRFAEIRTAQLSRIDRRVRFLIVLVSTAPLTGLLGTVVGMLATFAGLSLASSGRTVDLVSAGISEALITTQTGLMIAIPGYVFIYAINRRRNELALFLHRLESVTMKRFKQQYG